MRRYLVVRNEQKHVTAIPLQSDAERVRLCMPTSARSVVRKHEVRSKTACLLVLCMGCARLSAQPYARSGWRYLQPQLRATETQKAAYSAEQGGHLRTFAGRRLGESVASRVLSSRDAHEATQRLRECGEASSRSTLFTPFYRRDDERFACFVVLFFEEGCATGFGSV